MVIAVIRRGGGITGSQPWWLDVLEIYDDKETENDQNRVEHEHHCHYSSITNMNMKQF